MILSGKGIFPELPFLHVAFVTSWIGHHKEYVDHVIIPISQEGKMALEANLSGHRGTWGDGIGGPRRGKKGGMPTLLLGLMFHVTWSKLGMHGA